MSSVSLESCGYGELLGLLVYFIDQMPRDPLGMEEMLACADSCSGDARVGFFEGL